MTDRSSAPRTCPTRTWCATHRIEHLRTRPYRRTNGKAERFIQTMLREWAYAASYRTSTHRSGRRVLLDPMTPPSTPVLALVPQETDFDRQQGPAGVICDIDTCPDGGGGGSGGGTGGSGGTGGTGSSPPAQSLYLTRAQFVDTFEGWLKGNPEFELHVLGPVNLADSATMVSFQCVGEHAPTGYQWDMNGTNWSGTAAAGVPLVPAVTAAGICP